MIYPLLGFSLLLLFFAVLIWLRKVQYDGIHRNFLNLVDHYGGRIVRPGFASRPKYSGQFKDFPITVSFSTEKKNEGKSRQFYVSVFLQSPGKLNYTIMSKNWLSEPQLQALSGRFIHWLRDREYVVEVTDKKLLRKLDVRLIEEILSRLHPFAYVLVSKRGLILEKLSHNLLQDTEEEYLLPLFEGMYTLSNLTARRRISS
ncbi:MAG: hypothetical protein A2Y94_11990 [Caldithrix sp. RBG_13_44_9]|nr:MAG: hypothetical protein A2Y94_11990 [Caldithrix sp. RBG_13_44_9]